MKRHNPEIQRPDPPQFRRRMSVQPQLLSQRNVKRSSPNIEAVTLIVPNPSTSSDPSSLLPLVESGETLVPCMHTLPPLTIGTGREPPLRPGEGKREAVSKPETAKGLGEMKAQRSLEEGRPGTTPRMSPCSKGCSDPVWKAERPPLLSRLGPPVGTKLTQPTMHGTGELSARQSSGGPSTPLRGGRNYCAGSTPETRNRRLRASSTSMTSRISPLVENRAPPRVP